MNLLKTITTTFILASIMIFTSCEKEGPAGPAGRDGLDGNANVVSSSKTSSNWAYNDPSWVITLTYPSITQEIINSGAVLVYMQVGNTYYQIPSTFYESENYSSSLDVSIFVGGVSVFWTDSDLIQRTNPGSQTFKVVVIASSDLKKNPSINFSDYEQVVSEFDL